MDHQIEVTGAEDPAPSTVARKRRESGWTLLAAGAVGVVIGAMAVFLLSSSDAPAETSVTVAETALEAPPVVRGTQGTVRPPPSLAERVPGLTSDLVAFGFTPSGQAVIQQWFINAAEPRTIDVPFGLAIADASGEWIAALVDQRYGESSNLHIGNSTYQEAIATNVGSAVWSVDQPGRIAWTERTPAGAVALERSQGRGSDDQPFEFTPIPADARAVWLDGDRLTIATAGTLIAVQPDGTEVARLEGAEFVAGADGLATVLLDGELTLVDEDLVPIAAVPTSGTPCSARFARSDPGRRTPSFRLAVQCGADTRPAATVEVLDFDPITLTFVSRTTIELDEPAQMNWLESDRFLAMPQPDPVSRPRSTIAILDMDTGTVTELKWPGVVFGVIGTR